VKVDLHCHSLMSDGVLAPDQVAARAHANGVQMWALTDHDEVSGVAQAREAALGMGMQFITGVEISVTWSGHTVHLVGLNFDEHDPVLNAGLAGIRGGRAVRARKMADKLTSLGIPGSYEGALPYAGNPDLISRTHFARFLVDSGYCKSMQGAFDKYLADGGPGYVPMYWSSLENAVGWIVGAGGRAVIAHPGRYLYTPMQFDALFDEFKELGGTGIEVVTGSHTPDQYAHYAKVAKRYGFLASAGSDFHSPSEGKTDLGGIPPLPAGLQPVWHDWL